MTVSRSTTSNVYGSKKAKENGGKGGGGSEAETRPR